MKTVSIDVLLAKFLINRRFGLLWFGRGASFVGDNLFITTLIVWTTNIFGAQSTIAPTAVTLLMISAALPNVLGLVAGVFVDRWNDRTVMMVVDGIRCGLMLLLIPVCMGLQAANVPSIAEYSLVCVVVVAASSCTQFFNPSFLGLMRDVVDREEVPRASGLDQFARSIAVVLGPAAAVPLLLWVGVTGAILANAVSFALSFGALWLVGTSAAKAGGRERKSEDNLMADLLAGWRLCVDSRLLFMLILSSMAVVVGAGFFNPLNVFFVSRNLHSATAGLGIVNAGFGLGSIVGALMASRIIGRIGAQSVYVLSLTALGGLLILYSTQTVIWAGIAAFCVVGLAMTVVNVALRPILFEATPRGFTGRTSATLLSSNSLGSVVGLGLAGAIGAHLQQVNWQSGQFTIGGIQALFTGVGLLYVLAGSVTWLRWRGLAEVVATDDAPPRPTGSTSA